MEKIATTLKQFFFRVCVQNQDSARILYAYKLKKKKKYFFEGSVHSHFVSISNILGYPARSSIGQPWNAWNACYLLGVTSKKKHARREQRPALFLFRSLNANINDLCTPTHLSNLYF